MFLLHGYHRLHPWWEYTDLSPLSQPCLGSRSASNATQWESRSKVKSITISRHQISNKHVLKLRERKNRERPHNTKIQTAAHEASNFQPPGKAWQISAALTAFPQPLGYDPNWKWVANRDRPTEMPSYDHPWTCWNESIEGPWRWSQGWNHMKTGWESSVCRGEGLRKTL